MLGVVPGLPGQRPTLVGDGVVHPRGVAMDLGEGRSGGGDLRPERPALPLELLGPASSSGSAGTGRWWSGARAAAMVEKLPSHDALPGAAGWQPRATHRRTRHCRQLTDLEVLRLGNDLIAAPRRAAVTDSPSTPSQQPVKINTAVPQSARIWNYWLGGKDNYPVDRAAGEQYREAFPEIVDVARASRQFLTRAVRYLAGQTQVRQFLDVGTGLPTADNTHEVAQRVASDARIVYVDNDPLVLAHARALLTSTPQGATSYIDADLHEPDKILQAAAETLDFTRPVALMLMGILGHVTDYDEARSIVRRLLDALPSGSYLALNDGTNVISKAFAEAQQRYNESGAVPYHLRSPEQIAGFFDGLELVEPGVVSCPRWRPDPAKVGGGLPAELDAFGGVGRKP
jgi:O-methyltransferase involved in polyketide biosynthesis